MDLSKTLDYIEKQYRLYPDGIAFIDHNLQYKNTVYGQSIVDIVDLLSIPRENEYEKRSIGENTVYIFNFQEDMQIIIAYNQKDPKIKNKDLEHIHDLLYPVYAKEILKMKDRELDIIVSNMTIMNSSNSINELLDRILEGAINILEKVEAGYIQIYDEAYNQLIVRRALGFNDEIYEFKTNIGESVTGMVFKDGESRFYNSREEIENSASGKGLTRRNIEHLESSLDMAKLNGMISIPIEYASIKIGVMTLHQLDKKSQINSRDIVVLESFAAQAGIALRNSKLLNDLNENLEEVNALNQELDDKNQVINLKNKIYNDLTKVSLTNEGSEKIAELLSRYMEVPIIFFNTIKTEMVYNNLDVQLSNKEVIELVKKYEDGKGMGKEGIYFYPIRNGEILLGYIISKEDINANKKASIILEEGLLVLTLELMKNYTLADTLYKRTYEYFNRMINTKNVDQIYQYAERLKLPTNDWYICIVIESKDYSDLQSLELGTHYLVSYIRKSFQEYNALVYGFHTKIIFLVHHKEKYDQEELVKKIRDKLLIWKSKEKYKLIVGIGSYYRGVENIWKTYKESEKSLMYISSRKNISIIEYEKIGINSLFIDQQPEELARFIDDTLGPLREAEGEESDLEETLFKYIESNKSPKKAAEDLFIHINTLYKRIKRIEEILDIDFDNPEDTLRIQLACYLESENLINF